MQKGKKGSIDPSTGAEEADQTSPLVLAVASSPRVTRKRLGSNNFIAANADVSKEDCTLGKYLTAILKKSRSIEFEIMNRSRNRDREKIKLFFSCAFSVQEISAMNYFC